MIIDLEKLRHLAEKLLSSMGAHPKYAQIQVDLLREGEMRGLASPGLLRLKPIAAQIRNGVTAPRGSGSRQWLARGFLDVDGERDLGSVIALNALHAVSAHARKTGMQGDRIIGQPLPQRNPRFAHGRSARTRQRAG